jgi:hypothetical protein
MSRARIASIALALAPAACGVRLEGGGPADAPPDARPCTAGDARMPSPSGACFFVYTAPVAYADAQAGCAAQGAHLAILRSAEDDQIARALAGTLNVFIGLSDLELEGTFVWADGSAPTYTAWDMLEPNDGGGTYAEDCAVIAGPRGGVWDDRPCAPGPDHGGGTYAYLCEH